MKIIVTGATGFLGRYVIRELRSHGHDVIAVGRNKEVLSRLQSEGYETCEVDLRTQSSIEKMLPSADVLIHAAALSTVYGKREDFIAHNTNATKYLFETAQKKGIKRFVFVSSPSIYADRKDRFNIKEDEYDVNNKLNFYIESKIAAENYLLAQEKTKIEIVIMRPRGLFGVGDTSIFPRLLEANKKIGLPLFKQKGTSLIVDITCVENVAYALRLCTEKEGIDREVFNITNGEPVAFEQLMIRVFEGIGEEPRFKYRNPNSFYQIAKGIEGFYQRFNIQAEPPLTRYTVCTLAYSQTLCIDKAKQLLGYKPIMTVDEGVEKYIQSLKEER